jgi:hypothetical protein
MDIRMEGNPPVVVLEAVSGEAKLAQRLSVLLLNGAEGRPHGNMESDIQNRAVLAVDEAVAVIRGSERVDDPYDERVDYTSVGDMVVDGDSLSVPVKLITRAGTSTSLSI